MQSNEVEQSIQANQTEISLYLNNAKQSMHETGYTAIVFSANFNVNTLESPVHCTPLVKPAVEVTWSCSVSVSHIKPHPIEKPTKNGKNHMWLTFCVQSELPRLEVIVTVVWS